MCAYYVRGLTGRPLCSGARCHPQLSARRLAGERACTYRRRVSRGHASAPPDRRAGRGSPSWSVSVERTIRILVQTTTPGGPDDWSVESLSLLAEHLASLREDGTRFEVTARNREPIRAGTIRCSRSLDRSSFDELWLFALDTGDGLTPPTARESLDSARAAAASWPRAITRTWASLCATSAALAPRITSRRRTRSRIRRAGTPDDRGTPTISWPNYHSGNNGDFQRIARVEPSHPLLRNPDSAVRLDRVLSVASARRRGRCARRERGARRSRRARAWRPDAGSTSRSRSNRRRTTTERARPRRRRVELPPLRRLQLGHAASELPRS